MLNFKIGIVILDVVKVVEEIKVGKIEYCIDKVGNIYVLIGKVLFDLNKLYENMLVIYN